MPKVPDKVTVGLKFPYDVADGRCMFTVTEHVGKGVWRCVCDEGQDYAGSVANVDGRMILGILEMNSSFEMTFTRNSEWFESLPDGTVVHLSNGFRQFVRCRVETGEYEECLSGETSTGKHVVAIALVGNWRPFDLPSRRADGTVSLPYHAAHVVNGTHYRPGPQHMWESPYFQESELKDRDGDPRGLDPIPLDVPEMTGEEIETSRRILLIREARDLMTDEATDEALDRASTILASIPREVDG